LAELYWKAHFGFRRHGWRLTPAQHRELHSEFNPRELAALIENGIDPVEEILTRTVRVLGAPTSKPLQKLLPHWRSVESTLNARLVLATALLGPAGCATIFGPLLPYSVEDAVIYPCWLEGWIDGKALKARFGQPDLLLVNA